MNSENEKTTPGADEMEARLWAYLDGDSEESSEIEELLSENREWQEKYGELLEMQTFLKGADLEQPSLRFTKNVMEEIARQQIAPATRAYINKKIIWALAAFFLTVILSCLVAVFSQVNWAAGSEAGGDKIQAAADEFSGLFNNTLVNGFMVLNVVLGLFLLDRFLSARRKKASKV